MSILTGFKKVKNYILTSSGYQLLSRWTSSQTVEFDDGKTAQTKLGEINGIAKTYVDMKKATDNSMAVSAKAVMEGLENSSALISMTQAEYDALSDEEKTDNNMRAILDANPDVVDAKNVNFDNTNTNLTATNTQSAITELNGKLNQNTDLTLVNCVSWESDNTISKIGNRVFVTLGVQITSEQSSGSLIIASIARTYYPKTTYVRANAAGGTNGDNHMLYINKSNGVVILNLSTERYYSASFSYLSDWDLFEEAAQYLGLINYLYATTKFNINVASLLTFAIWYA